MRLPLLARIRSNPRLKVELFLRIAIVFNLAYSVFLFVVSAVYGSKWFLTMSIYYGLLFLMRVFILTCIKKRKQLRGKIMVMRACGYFLLAINLVVSTMTFILIYGNRYVIHREITVITLATYTFISLTVAIVSTIKHLPKSDYIFFCAKMVGLICASVSLTILTSTMLSTFGGNNEALNRVILTTLSGFVSIFIIACAIYMICKSHLDLRTIDNEKERR